MRNDLTQEQLAQEVTVTLPLGVLLQLQGPSQQPATITAVVSTRLPAIGEAFGEGIYAGVSIENERPVALVLLPGEEELKWKDAMEWAEKKGGTLPSRFDQLVLLKNLKGEFQATWYWSSTQYAGHESSAWCQGFGYGHQYGDHKSSELRARAVRRLPL